MAYKYEWKVKDVWGRGSLKKAEKGSRVVVSRNSLLISYPNNSAKCDASEN